MSFRDILLVTSDPSRKASLTAVFEAGGYTVAVLSAAEAATSRLTTQTQPLVAVLDSSLSIDDQFAATKRLRDRFKGLPVILIASSTKIGIALKASDQGVFWILAEPFENEELLYLVARGIVMHQLAIENAALKEALKSPLQTQDLIAHSEPMQLLTKRIHRVASLDTAVLLTGESGTGKTLLASVIHRNSPRKDAPFIALSCANFPRDLLESELFGHEKGSFTGAVATRPGTIELGAGGTLFLDEIGEMPLDLQPKLLTFLQDKKVRRIGGKNSKEVDVRVICATNKDLAKAVQRGEFREDLFYRVNVLHLIVPPLRDRKEDIPILAQQILRRIAERQGSTTGWRLTEDALESLSSYRWPGNVRELEHTIERATAFAESPDIKASDIEFPRELQNVSEKASLIGKTLKELEGQLVRETHIHCGGDKRAIAKMLGVSMKTVYNKLKEYGITD